MKGISHYRDAQDAGLALSPEFVDKVLGAPKCSVEQASYSAIALEADRRTTRALNIDQAISRLEFDRREIDAKLGRLRAEREEIRRG